jgi:hypothetical protein
MSPDSTRLSHQSYLPKEVLYCYKFLKIETSIINVQSREIGNIGYKDEDKQNTTEYVLDTTMCKQTEIMKIRHEPSYKQLEVKTNRT